ncbi:hypothetical protein K458DRAFT_363725 [Lentithecium fluviatile CBS 122367]|uniref:Uncharacterized protein n=1 Tax=Lentithecium fluviatile CBS 122367 TaxID=1168545 RepID=A0A6G1J7C8_9PLEO|nr:hypothetical protein K458DRAFT_363725 [Lentithecium fluviatile CBS 122367]
MNSFISLPGYLNQTFGKDSNDSLTETSNRIALAAAILAAGAFIVAFLQALLQYLSSNSSGYKCGKSAIHMWRHCTTRPKFSFREFRFKKYYAEVNFDCIKVLRMNQQDGRSVVVRFLSEKETFRRSSRLWKFWNRITRSGRRFEVMETGLVRVRRQELTLHQQIKLWWWLRQDHQLPKTPPRASWAQMLMALGIRDTKSLASGKPDIDADSIPANVDVPHQAVKLYDVGILAFAMGFTSVVIRPVAREFRAEGPFGVIVTEEVPTFGRVLRFEGDVHEINKTISRCPTGYILEGSLMLLGKLNFGRYSTPELPMVSFSLDLLASAIRRGWDNEFWNGAHDYFKGYNEVVRSQNSDNKQHPLLAGLLPGESSHFKENIQRAMVTEADQVIGCLGDVRLY